MYEELYTSKYYLHTNYLKERIENDTTICESTSTTWEISITLVSVYNEYVSFKNIDTIVNNVLEPYQKKLIDEVLPFNLIKPNAKSFCHFLKSKLEYKFAKLGCIVLSYEISETPTKIYIYNNIENIEYYKYKLYLTASHAVTFNDKLGNVHSHSFEFNIVIIDNENDFNKFSKINQKLEEFFEQYQYKTLNELEDFSNINPTLENITNMFNQKIKNILEKENCLLASLEIAETPSISYILNN